MGFLEDMFFSQQQSQLRLERQFGMNTQQATQRQSSLGEGLLWGLGGAMAGNVPISPMDIIKPPNKPIMTFIQTLRNEIDEWLKL